VSTNVIGPSSASAPACVAASLHFKGEISANEDLLVDGTVEGSIQLPGHNVTIGLNAKANAEVVARGIIVYGNVKGNLRASDRIEIKKEGWVVGALMAPRVIINEGAVVNGSVEVERKTSSVAPNTEKRSEKPASARTAAATAPSTRAS
jgi:cytoskeletal protein CcmA (bactofilin family)